MLIGVAEDSVRRPTLAEAKVEMDLLVQAGVQRCSGDPNLGAG